MYLANTWLMQVNLQKVSNIWMKHLPWRIKSVLCQHQDTVTQRNPDWLFGEGIWISLVSILRFALRITHKQSFIGARGLVLSDASNLLSIEGHYQQALKLAEESQTYSVNIWARRYMLWSYALVHCGLGHDDIALQTLLEALMMIVTATHSPTDVQLCLPIASVLLARAGQTHRAAELLELAYAAPPELTGWLSHWQLLSELQDNLKSELGEDKFNALWKIGSTIDLDVELMVKDLDRRA